MWGQPEYNEERDAHVIILDCEGFGHDKRNPQHDAKMFALANLLSSLLLINIEGPLKDEKIE